MEDPNLIATLIPTDDKKLAETAFCLEHNRDYYLAPTRVVENGRILSSREPTPADGDLIDDHCKYDLTHRLELSFRNEPKDPTKGFCFGSNLQICDVLLGHRGEGISNVHFHITFNEKKEFILKDSSTRGTAVSYNGQAKDEVRHHFIWILQPKKEDGVWETEVKVGDNLSFKVKFASHQSCAAEYNKKVEKFLAGLNDLTFNGLGIYTPTELPSLSLTPKRSPIYIRERELGRGSFGGVDQVIDVSTGVMYARKSFFEPQWGKYKKHREQKKEDWLSQVHREIRILKDSQHENIVNVVDARYELTPFLIMEYLCFGNLEDSKNMRDFCEEDVVGLLYQALNALRYLHTRGIAHRDLKPANMLIKSRTPLHIKLADFGLANDKPDLATLCGTQLYLAPEVCLGTRYTTAVDLWSLGVIIFEYAYGLPNTKLRVPRKKHEAWGLAWCRRIIDHANDWDSDVLIDFLTAGLLQMKPTERLSADACLRKGSSIGLFNGSSIDSGSVTPRPGSTLQAGISDREGSTTIILGALWGMEGGNPNQDSKSRRGHFPTLQYTSGARESHTNRAAPSPSNGHSHDAQLGGFGTSSAPTANDDQSLANLLCPTETISRGSKRLRSPAISPANYPSSSKRRPKEDFSTEILVRRTNQNSNRQASQYSAAYDGIVALLTDLWVADSESQEIDIDDHTSILIGELCSYLTQLEITGMRLAQNNHSGQAILATGSNGREIMLASLTSSKLVSSITDLVMHLLQMVQDTPIAQKDPSKADAVAHDCHRSWEVDAIGSSATISSAREHGVTYPSALLDCTNVSGCSIPIESKRSARVK